jgi:hypothetical protein
MISVQVHVGNLSGAGLFSRIFELISDIRLLIKRNLLLSNYRVILCTVYIIFPYLCVEYRYFQRKLSAILFYSRVPPSNTVPFNKNEEWADRPFSCVDKASDNNPLFSRAF